MWCFKCFKSNTNEDREGKTHEEQGLIQEEVEARADTTVNIDEEARDIDEEVRDLHGIKFVYFALDIPKDDILDVLKSITRDAQTFTVETECIEYIKTITNKVFLIIDGSLPSRFFEEIENLIQIDSVFIYSLSLPVDSIAYINEKQHPYLVYLCENKIVLMNSIQKSHEEFDKQIAAFSMYNKQEKATRNLSKELGSYLFFQIFKNIIQNMSKTYQAKQTMIRICRIYYRGNSVELANIDEFDRIYKSSDAIQWFLKDCFLYKFINKVLRTEEVDVLYQFRFYILDLSEQLQLKYLELRKKQNNILKLYRGLKLSEEEIINYQNNIGNGISINEYLSTTSERSIAYNYVINITKNENLVRALFEYQIDFNIAKKMILADIREYSAYPKENEFLFDFGSKFQIDSCSYNTEEDLWYIQLHATDHFDNFIDEYIEYQKKKMMESNITLMFGNLLIEMGEYNKAEKYFDTLLNSSNPNDEEIASIFYNYGRIHRLKGDFNRAINCYNRAHILHLNARPKRRASAGKTLNGLGVVYSEQRKLFKAEECFKRAMKLYKKSLPKNHIDIAATLINLGTIHSEQQNYDQAVTKYLKAKKIYNRSLPAVHPNQALPRINLGNIYLLTNKYEKALEEYENALKLQQTSLPVEHPDIIRTLHNLSVVYVHQGKIELSKQYLEHAEEIASRTVSAEHPLMILINKTKNSLLEDIHQ